MTLERADGEPIEITRRTRRAPRGRAPGRLPRPRRIRRLQPPRARGGARLARRRDGAGARRATCARSASPSARTTSPRRSRQPRRSRPASSRCSSARFDPRLDATTAERSAREAAIRAEIEDALQIVTSLDEDRILRRFINLVEAAIRTNFFQLGAGRAAAPDDRVQVRLRARSRACRCRGRSTRSSSIRRASKACTCASARSRAAACAGPTGRRISAPRSSASSRRSRSRTPSSCRSAPRAASCPSTCRRRPTARPGWRRAPRAYRIFVRTLLELTDNLDGDAVVPPPRHRAPRRRRPLSRGRRRQGHRDLLRHRQRALDREGPLARRRLRLRRQPGLRPQEDGHHRARRLGGGEAPFPRDRHRHPDDARSPSAGVGDMSGDVFGNGMLLSPATEARRGLRPSRHLPRSRSRIRRRASPSASACSTCRARAGRTTTRR